MKRKYVLFFLVFLLSLNLVSITNVKAASSSWVTQIQADGVNVMILKENGDLIAWGSNWNNTIDNTNSRVNEPKKISGNVKQFSLANTYVTMVKKNGTIQNKDGETILNISDAISVLDLGRAGILYINESHELWKFYEDKLTKIMDNVKQVSSNIGVNKTFMALTYDGKLWGWGSNYNHLLDNDKYEYESFETPTLIMDEVKFVSMPEHSNSFVTVIKNNNELWEWGRNTYEPTKIMSDVRFVSNGNGFTMAITNSDELWGWGDNYMGQIGNDTQNNEVLTPVQILTNVNTVVAGNQQTIAVRNNGELWGWGSNDFKDINKHLPEGNITVPMKFMDPPKSESNGNEVGNYKGVSSWALAEIIEADKAGILTPVKNTTFNQSINREQFSEIVMKFYEKMTGSSPPSVVKNPFSDTKNSSVIQAFNLGIVKGISEGKFAPKQLITREEISVMLNRALEKARPDSDYGYVYKRFEDEQLFSTWANDAIKKLRSMEIIKGDSENKFNPKKNTTIEEAVLMTYRLLQKAD